MIKSLTLISGVLRGMNIMYLLIGYPEKNVTQDSTPEKKKKASITFI